MEKKKITLKEIGLPRLLLMLGAGLLLLFLSLPGEQEEKAEGGQADNGQANLTDAQALGGESAGVSILQGSSTAQAAEYLEERLETLLRKVKGIGEVEVMITLKSSAETVVLKDTPYTYGETV